MFTARIAEFFYRLDRWQETSILISRIRRWTRAGHDAYSAKRYNKLLKRLRDLTALDAQILMSGNLARKLPRLQRKIARLSRAVARFDGSPKDKASLAHALTTLELVSTAEREVGYRPAKQAL